MALNSPQNKNTNAQGSTMSEAFSRTQEQQRSEQQQPQAAQATQSRTQRVRLSDIGSLTRTAMGRSPTSEVLTRLSTALAKQYQGSDKSYEITLVPIDLENTKNLDKSVIAVAVRDNLNKEIGVAYHTLILADSSPARQPRYEVINGHNTEVIWVAGDANNRSLSEEVHEFVKRTFPNDVLWPVDACVVPNGFNAEDETLVYELAANAALACTTELEMRQPGGFVDLDLGAVEQDNTLTVQTTFGQPQVRDVVGAPLRADVNIDFRAGGQPVAGQPGVTGRVSVISKIRGYVDLVWAPAAPQNQNNPWAPVTATVESPDKYKRYQPRFVMTDLESARLLTIPAQLLALVTALTLRQDNAWVEAYRPTPMGNAGEVDWKDIGAVGIEANFENNPTGYGERVDTKSDAFQRGQGQQGDHLVRLVAAVMQPRLVVSLDVPECGPQTWFNGVFSAAAEIGSPGASKANDIIIRAANTLTHNNFGKYFQAGARVAIDEYNRIHLGTYLDGRGVKRDLREVDYLAVLNLAGNRDPEVAREWSDSFSRTDLPLEVRLAKRKQIIIGLLGPQNVEFTGFARRVTFEPAFLEALFQACKDSGLSVRTIAPTTDLNQYERAVNPYAVAAGLDASGGANGVFNRGYGGGQQQQYGARGGFSRWTQ